MEKIKIDERYTEEEKTVIYKFFDKLSNSTRKCGRIEPSKKEKILAECQKFDKRAVISAMEIYIRMDIPKSEGGRGKNEKYLMGIIKNKQKELMCCAKTKRRIFETEGARIAKIAGQFGNEERECSF